MKSSSKLWRSILYISGIVIFLALLSNWENFSRLSKWGKNYQYRIEESLKNTPTVDFQGIAIDLLELKKGKQVSIQAKAPIKSLKELLKQHPEGLLLNFWATWCPPCIDELPSLEQYHRQASKLRQLPKLVLISIDESITPIQTLFQTLDFQPSFRLLLDKRATLAQAMGSAKFPETYLLSSQGQVLYKWVGPQNWLSAEVLDKIKLVTSSHPNK